MRNLLDSTYGMNERFKRGMHAKQERVDSLNYFLLHRILNTYIFVFFCNQTSRFIYRSGSNYGAMLFTISTSYSQYNKSIG